MKVKVEYLNLNVIKWQKGICWVGEEGRLVVVGFKKLGRVMAFLRSNIKNWSGNKRWGHRWDDFKK